MLNQTASYSLGDASLFHQACPVAGLGREGSKLGIQHTLGVKHLAIGGIGT